MLRPSTGRAARRLTHLSTNERACASRRMETPYNGTTLACVRSSAYGVDVTKPFSVLERARSFKYALRGIAVVFRSQHNAWIHALASAMVVALGLLLALPPSSWCWLVGAITAVWTAEAINTSLERLADATVPELHPLVRDAKDAAAGAVLIAAAGAVVIGMLVLGPPLWTLLYG